MVTEEPDRPPSVEAIRQLGANLASAIRRDANAIMRNAIMRDVKRWWAIIEAERQEREEAWGAAEVEYQRSEMRRKRHLRAMPSGDDDPDEAS